VNAYALEIVAEEVPPDRVPKKRKRRSSVAADITVRDFGPGAKLFGRYTLSRILGRGGMGIVWLARDEELDRQVALKFLSQQIIHDHALLDDLKRETKRSLELTHPNIVRIHDFFQDARSACISMEFVDGETLSNLRVSKRNQIFEVPDLEPLVAQWCEAMHYAHVHARVVHCDLKPANLMLNAKGLLKITDFGIARSLSESASKLTATRSTSGTLVYMSPQQLNGDPASVSDDIYSMGATLYELLTGKPPFYRGQIDLQIFDKIPPLIAVRRTELGARSPFIVPLQWEDTIAACLSKEPGERPRGALELLNRLNLISPLRKETPLVLPKIKETQEPPLPPGTFELMHNQPGATLASAPVPRRSVSPISESSLKQADHLAVGAASDPTSSRTDEKLEAPIPPDPRSVGRPSDRIFVGRRRYFVAIVLALGAMLIIGLWYLVSSISRSSVKELPRPNFGVTSTPFPPNPTLSQLSPRRNQKPAAPSATPTTSAAPSPTPEPSVASTPVETATPDASTQNEERGAVPKDDLTRFRNEVLASERAILSPHETKTVQERLKTMTVDGRKSYVKAIEALEEGYPSVAQSFAFEVERAEGEHPLSFYLRGLILLSQGKLDESESALARAATLDSEFREVEYNLASVAFKKKDYARARKRFEHLLSAITSPSERLKQLLQYRIYLGFLLEGAADDAQKLVQNMRANAETPAFYYAHAAWEFRRNDGAIAKQWMDSALLQQSDDLRLLFLEPLYDVGWLNPPPNNESTPSPSVAPSATATPSPVLQTLSLTEITLSKQTNANAAVDLRLLIGVASKPNTPDGHSIDIRVSFFDITPTGRTVPTDARTSYRWTTLKRIWSEPTTKYLVATYVRPKTSTGAKTTRKYGGYIVRLYFDGRFQDERAAPTALLKTFQTDTQAMPLTPGVSPSPSSHSLVEASVTPAPAASISPADADRPASTTSPQSDIPSEISILEDKWAVAVLLHDADAIRSLLADTYEAITPTGRKWSKSQAVQRISDDTDKYDLVEVEKINVRTESATSAVATGLLRQRGKFSSGKSFERAYTFTDDWTKSDGKWLCTRSRTERPPKH
jgi:serine/threonine protein kinase/tetratricopeptide (TPR) repeat protein/ketosteroid isomerase-like protein